jgi:putative addiction module component (TIGR02574 family)
VNARLKRLVDEVRDLPPSERRLVRDLLEDDDEEEESEASSSSAWSAELIRRAEAAHAGTGKTSSVEEHLARLRARLLK